MNKMRYSKFIMLVLVSSWLSHSCSPAQLQNTPTPAINVSETETSTSPSPTKTTIPQSNQFSVEEMETLLQQANIILSWEDEEVVRGYLTTDPAYQSLANLCINLLEEKKVVDSVPLDVINAKYKEQFGVAPDKNLPPAEYDDVEILKVAIYNAWKERYYADNPRTSFDEIVIDR